MTTLEDEVISARDTHNHPSGATELEADKIVATVKHKAMESAQPITSMKSIRLPAELTWRKLQLTCQLSSL